MDKAASRIRLLQLAVLSVRNANIVHQNSNTMVWRGRIFTL